MWTKDKWYTTNCGLSCCYLFVFKKRGVLCFIQSSWPSLKVSHYNVEKFNKINVPLGVWVNAEQTVFLLGRLSTCRNLKFCKNSVKRIQGFSFLQPYLNGGTPNSSWEMPSMKSAIYVSGPINNASVPGDWSWTIQFEFMSTVSKSSVKPL